MRYTRNGNCCACMAAARNGFAATDDEGRVSMVVRTFPALRDAVAAHAAALEIAYLMTVPAGVPVATWEAAHRRSYIRLNRPA